MREDYSGWHWENADPYVGIVLYPPERFNDIKVPTLILAGECNLEDYHIYADIQNRNIPHSRKEIVPEAGHALNIENPAKFNQLFLKFLSENRSTFYLVKGGN